MSINPNLQTLSKNQRLQCPVCHASELSIINTYKHRWYTCQKCGNAFRVRKEKYLINRLSRFLLKCQPKLGHLLPDFSAIDDSSRMYDYMASEEHTRNDEQAESFEKFTSRIIKKHNIDFNGKRVLDISGGNGNFANKLDGLGARVTMTEYSSVSVEYARKHYGIEAVRFDFQSDCISELLQEKYDIVLLRAAIMFCLDISAFIHDLKRILHPGSQVLIVSSVPPSLGVFLRWQFDDYTYLRLY